MYGFQRIGEDFRMPEIYSQNRSLGGGIVENWVENFWKNRVKWDYNSGRESRQKNVSKKEENKLGKKIRIFLDKRSSDF
jgi:hypothetical protein